MKSFNKFIKNSVLMNLALSFFSILIIFILFEFYSIEKFKIMKNISQDIHLHPLQVSNASLSAKLEIYKIHQNMQKILSSSDKNEMEQLLKEIEENEKVFSKNLNIIKSRILGDRGKELEKEVRELSLKCKNIRVKIINLIQNGEKEKAILFQQKHSLRSTINAKMDELYSYAHLRADKFIEYSNNEFENIKNERVILIILISILILLIAFFTLKKIFYYISKIEEFNVSLKNSEDRYKTLVNNLPQRIFLKDINSKYISCNKSYANDIGVDLNEIYGKSDFDFFPKELAQKYRNDDKEIMKNGKIVTIEEEYFKDNERRYVNTVKVPIKDKDKTVGIIGIFWDITEEKLMQEELHKKEEMMIAQSRQAAMGDMISMIAHQWRQPITTVGMSANNMILDISLQDINEDKFLEHLSVINEQVQYLSKTIDDFRDFFKPNKEIEIANLSDLIYKTISIVGKSLDNANIDLKIDLKDNIEFATYPNEITQVLLNIINNAKEAIKERKIKNGFIDISGYLKDGNIIIKICDNAGGIKGEYKDKIFNPYFTTKEADGTGLGLYMSKVIIEKHLNGSLNFYNEKEGVCFVIIFKYEILT